MGSYVCGDCAVWVNSQYADRDGWKYCKYYKRYFPEDESIYNMHGGRCEHFAPVGRIIITNVCNILNINPSKYFKAFDMVEETTIIPSCIDKLIDYNTVGPVISSKLNNCAKKEQLAKNILINYIDPAYDKYEEKDYQGAITLYERMVKVLALMFGVTKDNIHNIALQGDYIDSDLFIDCAIRLK